MFVVVPWALNVDIASSPTTIPKSSCPLGSKYKLSNFVLSTNDEVYLNPAWSNIVSSVALALIAGKNCLNVTG